MRLTSLAVILQSASFFVTTFAVGTKSHINEEDKEFDCSGRKFLPAEYNHVERMQLTDPVNELGLTMDGIYKDLLQDRTEKGMCAFKDKDDGYYKYFQLINLWTSRKVENGNAMYSYILVSDRNNRANAMIKRMTIYAVDGTSKESYSICKIR
ncbi:unnamed protein product [Blumeria hordei]|uniref:Uncharacterized protein n=1 Tax=Blumeria hordei TaxID=2867405 RepID=A0A383UWS6_BLUHO|nr:unnamed protein product [Blumeria hordei]